MGTGDRLRSFLGYVAGRVGVDEADVLGADLMTHDLTPSTLSGVDREFVSAPRLDNQVTCYAGLEALLAAEPSGHVRCWRCSTTRGSTSDHGAQSELLLTVLERVVLAGGGDRRLPAPIAGLGGGVG